GEAKGVHEVGKHIKTAKAGRSFQSEFLGNFSLGSRGAVVVRWHNFWVLLLRREFCVATILYHKRSPIFRAFQLISTVFLARQSINPCVIPVKYSGIFPA